MNLGFLVVTCLLFTPIVDPGASRSIDFWALADATRIVTFMTIALTDGVLVWRCYIVQSVLGPHRRKWWKLLWLLPLCVYVEMIAAGVASVAIGAQTPKHSFPGALLMLILVSNCVLNTYATCFITARLAWHQRLVDVHSVASTESSSSATTQATTRPRHHQIIRVLIESAAINIPVALTAAVGAFNRLPYYFILGNITVSCQSFSTILILYQVALGKAIGQVHVHVYEKTIREESVPDRG